MNRRRFEFLPTENNFIEVAVRPTPLYPTSIDPSASTSTPPSPSTSVDPLAQGDGDLNVSNRNSNRFIQYLPNYETLSKWEDEGVEDEEGIPRFPDPSFDRKKEVALAATWSLQQLYSEMDRKVLGPIDRGSTTQKHEDENMMYTYKASALTNSGAVNEKGQIAHTDVSTPQGKKQEGNFSTITCLNQGGMTIMVREDTHIASDDLDLIPFLFVFLGCSWESYGGGNVWHASL